MSSDERDYKDLYFKVRRESFIAQVAYSKGVELVNLILNPGSIGSIEDCAQQFRESIKSAQRFMDQVDAGDTELANYFVFHLFYTNFSKRMEGRSERYLDAWVSVSMRISESSMVEGCFAFFSIFVQFCCYN